MVFLPFQYVGIDQEIRSSASGMAAWRIARISLSLGCTASFCKAMYASVLPS